MPKPQQEADLGGLLVHRLQGICLVSADRLEKLNDILPAVHGICSHCPCLTRAPKSGTLLRVLSLKVTLGVMREGNFAESR